ncbi:hypothetical protein [Bacillus sp. JJ1562]|uniref:hypothetical protein n=1 Tax=Bacillus sp. JJ1562 TaxID=3122960 RepID=UPI00300346F4
MKKLFKFIKDTIFHDNTDYTIVTLENLEKMMEQNEFDPSVTKELLTIFQERINKGGEEQFQRWLGKLQFMVPEEFKDEQIATEFYRKHSSWIEQEIREMEEDTEIPWEDLSEDLYELNVEARKAQMVLRDRISELFFDLQDSI